jgi:hypothetical protein
MVIKHVHNFLSSQNFSRSRLVSLCQFKPITDLHLAALLVELNNKFLVVIQISIEDYLF